MKILFSCSNGALVFYYTCIYYNKIFSLLFNFTLDIALPIDVTFLSGYNEAISILLYKKKSK